MSSEKSGAPPVLHTVSIEDNDQYYQGEVLPDSNIRHGEGTLLDKKEMYKYVGSFKFGMKDGEAGQLEYIDDEAEIQEYTGGFKEDKFHGMGILYLRSGQLFKGEFDHGSMKEGIMKYENGEEYTGPFKDGKRDGYGIMKYNSGEQYCGDFVADLKEGKGILSHFDTVINGVWKADVLVMGQHKQADGVYFGSFDEKKLPNGKGIFSYENGYIYQGNWKNGLQHGWGTFKDDTSIYEGLWENGSKTEGTLKYEEGDVYVGTFVNGMKECGVMMYKNGDEFSGEFKDSRRFMGVMTFKQSGDVYRGEFNEKGLFHGGGDLQSAEGDVYKGTFVNGAKQGQGQMILKDNGGTYVGDFNEDLMHGNGCFTMPDGSEYVGEFFEGVQHGDGMIITSSGTEIFGRWVNGKYQQLEYSIELDETNQPVEDE